MSAVCKDAQKRSGAGEGWIAGESGVVVSIAPSLEAGLLKYKTIGQVRGALIRFSLRMRETSEGAAWRRQSMPLLKEHQMVSHFIGHLLPQCHDLIDAHPELVKIPGAGGIP